MYEHEKSEVREPGAERPEPKSGRKLFYHKIRRVLAAILVTVLISQNLTYAQPSRAAQSFSSRGSTATSSEAGQETARDVEDIPGTEDVLETEDILEKDDILETEDIQPELPEEIEVMEIAPLLLPDSTWDGSIADDFAGGSGTEGAPYLIAAASQLAYLAQRVNSGTTYSGKYFELTCDIDLDYFEWTPIGNSSRSFKGNFDGSNYEIRGVYINSQSNYQGLFGKGESSCIKNINIIDASITGGNYVGGIVGYATSSIDNCSIMGSVIGNSYVGGIAGQGASFTNCANNGEEVTGSGNKIGGIAGYKTGALACGGLYNSAKITGVTDVGGIFGDRVASELTDSENIGDVAGNGNCVGGIVGINGGGLMRNCVNTGEITNTGLYTGGIFGNKSTTTDLIVDHCMNKGNVTGGDYTGGIIGRKTSRNIEVTSCENTGNIKGADYVGGIGGSITEYTTVIEDCFNSGSVTGNNYVGGIAGQGPSFTNCTNNGEEVTGNGNKVGGIAGYKTGALACGGLYNSAKITGVTDVGGIFGDRVTSELTDSENIGDVAGNGNCVGGIVGVNGGGLMRNCVNTGEITNTGLYTGGIFGNKSTTTDLIVEHCMNKGNVMGGDYTGGIIGRKTSRNIEVTSCENAGNIKGADYVGGIGGSITGSTTVIEDCINTGLIAGVNYLGGIVGQTDREIKNCNNANNISGYDYVGGIAGRSTASMVNCVNTVLVTGNSYVGGIAGYVSGSIGESFNTGEVTGIGDRVSGIAGHVQNGPVSNCYNTGAVTGGGDTGGIVGYHYANSSGGRYIENCYNSGSITGQGNTGSLIGNYRYAITIKNSYYLEGTAGAGVGYGNMAVTGTEVTSAELKALAPVLGDTYADDTNNVNQGYPILSALEYTGPDSSIMGTVPLSIVDGTNGKALTNARLTLRDSTGVVVYQGIAPGYLYLSEGTYQAVISCSGYYTHQREIIIVQGENDEVFIPLNGSNTLGAQIVVTQMTLEDMKAAGIDPDAVGNQQLFLFEVTLEFAARNPVEFSYIGTAEGGAWNPTGPIIIPARSGGTNESESEIHIYPISEKFYLVLYGTTKWTKEMFDAELIVVNNSLYETMEDCHASLDALPEGLSLAEMSGGEQTLEVDLGTIAPGGADSIHWYLRGDEPGSYQISGRVSAEMSGGDVLEAEFQTYEPIKVLAGSAMHLYITVEDKTWENDIYNVIFELKNVSDWPVYNLSLKLDQEQQYRVKKKNGSETTKEYLAEELENYVETESLLPGESLVLEFSTIIKFESELVADPEYVLVGMWLEMLEGSTTSIPYTFRLVSGVREISRWLSLLEFFTLKECLSEDPVNVLTGDFLWSYTDLTLSGRHDLSYTRYYTSTQTSYGRLGKGWSDNYDYRLYDRGEAVVISLPVGGQTHFLKDGTDYMPIQGSSWQLAAEGDGYLLTMHDQSRYHFDEDGNLTQVEVLGGSTLDISYDGAGQLATASNASGALEFYYREDGRVETVEDSAGRQVLFSYSDTGKLEHSENPDGDSLAYAYDDYGRLSQITDFNGNLYLTNEYDTDSRVTRQYVEGMGEFAYSYNEVTHTNHYTRSDGSRVTIVYDDQNRIISETDGDGTQTYTYSSSSQRTKEVDRNGNTTTYTYDEAGNVIQIGYEDGSQEQFAYNDKNRMIEWTAGEEITTIYIYNSSGTVTEVTDVKKITTFYTYNGVGNLTEVTDARGYVTAYGYDGDENLTEVLFPDGSQLHLAYDEKGNCTQATDALGNCTTYTYDEAGRVTSQTDPEGHMITYIYSTAGKLETVTDGLGNQTCYTTNGNGYNTGIRDANGNQTSYTYNTQNQLTGVTDGVGNQTRIDYDELGNRSAVTDGKGNTVSYTCDHAGRVTAFTDANGNTTYYDYDANGNQTRIINALGDQTAWEYDSRNRPVSLTDELGHTTRCAYDIRGQMTALTDALGAMTQFIYDGAGNVIAITDGNGSQTTYEYDARNRVAATTDQTGARSIYAYDEAGNLTAITDGAGNTATYGYDTLNRVISRTDGNGNTRTTAYDAGGRIISTIDEKGAETRYGYDNAGNITSRTDALGQTTRYTYDGADRLVGVTAPDGAVATYEYDGADNLTAVRYADGTSTRYQYDANGNVTAETDPNGTTTAYAYDALNRLTGITYADGGTRTYGYDAASNRVTVTDEKGSITRYTYDAAARMTNRTDALGTETRFEYDAMGNLTRLIQMCTGGGTSQSEVTAYEYDQAGRLIKETDALGNQTGYRYDEAGQVTGRKDADGGDTGYRYDGAGNLIGVTYSDGRSVSYQYNPANELTGYTDWLGTTSYELDLLGQIVAVNDSNGYQVSYRYDAQGNQTGITYPDGSQTVYQYDNVNQLTGITASGAQITYVYDANGNLTGIGKADGSYETRSYDSRNRLTQVDVDGRRQGVYTYDGAGNLLVSHELFGGTETSASYVYDPLSRLITDVSYGEERTQTDYTYDSLGNLIKEMQTTADIKTETAYAYNNLNQLIQKGTTAYEYDHRGNLIRERENGVVTASYTYDSTNRMTSGRKGRETSRYTYDGIGRLVRSGNAAGETTYVTDQTMSVDLPLSSMNGGKTSNHVYGAEGTAAIGYEGIIYTIASDRLGSIRRITSPEGIEIAGFTYDAWGRPEKTVAEGYEASGLGVANYTGHLYDETLELYYAKARIYDPQVGRFTSEDPIKDGLNWYTYCENNPVNRIDPSGLDSYILYDPNATSGDKKHTFYDEALIRQGQLEEQYGTTAHLIDTVNASAFQKQWSDKVGYDSSGNPVDIDEIVIILHGTAKVGINSESGKGYGYMYFESGTRITAAENVTRKGDVGIWDLVPKEMDTLYFSSCNTGNPDVENVADKFKSQMKINNKIVAWDGGTIFNYSTNELEMGGYGGWYKEFKRQPTYYKFVEKNIYGKPLRKRQGKVIITIPQVIEPRHGMIV